MLISELINILSTVQQELGDIPVQMYLDKEQSEDSKNNSQTVFVDNVKLVKIGDDSKSILLSNEYNEHIFIEGYSCDILFKDGEYLGQIKPPYSDTIINFKCTDKYHLQRACMELVENHRNQHCNDKIYETYQKIKDIQS